MDKSQHAAAVFHKLANLYQDKFMNVDMYGDTFDFFCNSIATPNAEVLELACGPGNITKYLLNKRPDFKILGTDLAPNMLALARINNPHAEFQLMDCRDIARLNKQFDAIMCGFCLPYLSKEETQTLIRDASLLLKPNSVLYISTMEDDYSKSGPKKGSTGDEIYIHYHEATYLTDFLTKNGFTVLDLQRKDFPNTDGTITTDLILIAQK